MTVPPTSSHRSDTLGGLAFVALWSTGYIAAEFALTGGGAFTVAVLRFAASALIIGGWLLWRPASPAGRSALRRAAVAGVLLQAGFFGFTYAGMRAGVPPAAAGLIAGLMPLVTALGAAVLLGERMTRWTLPGLLLGLAGVLLVIAPQLRAPDSALGYAAMLAALLSLSGGTLYQKRHSGALDPRLSLWVQLVAAGLVLLPFAAALEGLQYTPGPAAFGGLAWVILVNSCAGLLLYLWLLHRGAAARVAGLFYLVPPATALMAAIVLGAGFGGREIGGFALAAAGVWLGQRR
ncbi:MAG: DMT family transporter [Pseudomonadota bacterium]|uniref:DMT family transporter n=1 Tax=Sinimarinibacterium flocculans TaxID=985250 RepID=UPI002491B7A5|nr:DMT family transporter [Sinimarinibacterium flocculans]MEC9365113.1 DMT family transporter [Pseudomonadota bacterium]